MEASGYFVPTPATSYETETISMSPLPLALLRFLPHLLSESHHFTLHLQSVCPRVSQCAPLSLCPRVRTSKCSPAAQAHHQAYSGPPQSWDQVPLSLGVTQLSLPFLHMIARLSLTSLWVLNASADLRLPLPYLLTPGLHFNCMHDRFMQTVGALCSTAPAAPASAGCANPADPIQFTSRKPPRTPPWVGLCLPSLLHLAHTGTVTNNQRRFVNNVKGSCL